jgi:hypothetical protein
MTNRLVWLSDEAHSHGWTLLARHRDARITYVLVDEHGEMEFDTLGEVEQENAEHVPHTQASGVARCLVVPGSRSLGRPSFGSAKALS